MASTGSDDPSTPDGSTRPPPDAGTTGHWTSLSSTVFHRGAVGHDLAAFVRGAKRPIDVVLERARREKDPGWIPALVEGAIGRPEAPAEAALLEGAGGLERLREVHAEAKRLYEKQRPDSDRSLAATSAYLLAIAAALARHRELISGQPRSTLDPQLSALASRLPPAWRSLVEAGLRCRQHLPEFRTERFRAELGRGLDPLRQRVMRLYYHPLQIYVRSTSYRTLSTPEDLVGGFFESRLSRDDYLRDWLGRRDEGRTTLRLGQWLRNGLLLYCREQLPDPEREEMRRRKAARPGSVPQPPPEYYAELLAGILGEMRERLERTGAPDWIRRAGVALVRKHLEGTRLRETAGELGVNEATLRKNVERARPHLQELFREILREQGVRPDEVGTAIDVMLERTSPADF